MSEETPEELLEGRDRFFREMLGEHLCGEDEATVAESVMSQERLPDFARLVGQMDSAQRRFVVATLLRVGRGFHGYALAAERDFDDLFRERGRAMTVREQEMLRVFADGFLRVLKDLSTVARG